jgi:hypothetical protein
VADATPQPQALYVFNMKQLAILVGTAVFAFLYFQFLYREDISKVAAFAVPFLLFAPILLGSILLRINLAIINGLAFTGFLIGFVAGVDSNIWPIALAFWLFLSLPAIILLNAIAYAYKKAYA